MIVVDIQVPNLNRTYDFELDEEMKTGELLKKIIQTISEKESLKDCREDEMLLYDLNRETVRKPFFKTAGGEKRGTAIFDLTGRRKEKVTDWDCMIVAERLKEKQTAMQESHTRIVDALNGARDELTALRGKWKGSASDEFFASFFREWEQACEELEKTAGLIAAFTVAEQVFESCEAQIGEI